MKLRSFFKALGVVVAGLLLVAAAGFYWIFAHSPLTLLREASLAPAASIFVPKQAPAMVSLLVNPDRLEAFQQISTRPGERRQAHQELTQFKQGWLADTGLNYAQDIQPWLGEELTLALTTLDIDRDPTNGSQPGYLLAIATKDPERSREFLELFWQKRAIAGADLTFEQYQGVKLIYTENPWLQPKDAKAKNKAKEDFPAGLTSSLKPSSLASAVVGNQFVLFANHPKVLRDAVTNVQAQDLNLSQSKVYTKALTALTGPRIGLAIVNLPQVARWLEAEAITPAKETSAGQDTLKQVAAALPDGTYETMAIAVGLERLGLMAEIALLTADGKGPTITPPLSEPVGALQYLPASSSFSASGQDLNQVWNQLSDSLQGYDRLSLLIHQPLQTLETRWQLNVPQDIFSWVKGEYALGLVADTGKTDRVDSRGKKRGQGRASQFVDALAEQDWVFVAERSNTSASQEAIAHLDDLAKQKGYSVGSLQLGGQQVSAWTRLSTTAQNSSNTLQADVRGVHTSINNYEIFATSVQAMEAALQAINHSLADEKQFRQAIAPMHQPNNGYLYLDWPASRPILERQFPLLKVIELAGSPIFKHLRSLTLSSYGSQSGLQRGGVFIQLS
jgi:hypothetical protein